MSNALSKTSVVDETSGEIMIFLTALHPALSMYKSRDHGRTWALEEITFKKDSRGFLPIPNGACDPGITLRKGPHKGRLLVASRVMPNYNKQEEGKRAQHTPPRMVVLNEYPRTPPVKERVGLMKSAKSACF